MIAYILPVPFLWISEFQYWAVMLCLLNLKLKYFNRDRHYENYPHYSLADSSAIVWNSWIPSVPVVTSVISRGIYFCAQSVAHFNDSEIQEDMQNWFCIPSPKASLLSMLWKQQVSIFVIIIWADYVLCFYSEAFSSKEVYATTNWEKAKQHSRGICLKIASCKFPLTKLAWFMIEKGPQCTYCMSQIRMIQNCLWKSIFPTLVLMIIIILKLCMFMLSRTMKLVSSRGLKGNV